MKAEKGINLKANIKRMRRKAFRESQSDHINSISSNKSKCEKAYVN
jgi:hypothetical protein